jgi:hypothetical protein
VFRFLESFSTTIHNIPRRVTVFFVSLALFLFNGFQLKGWGILKLKLRGHTAPEAGDEEIQKFTNVSLTSVRLLYWCLKSNALVILHWLYLQTDYKTYLILHNIKNVVPASQSTLHLHSTDQLLSAL